MRYQRLLELRSAGAQVTLLACDSHRGGEHACTLDRCWSHAAVSVESRTGSSSPSWWDVIAGDRQYMMDAFGGERLL